jgi:predicted RNA-binding Zn-ribbon protein involved in translation (DUF1610 family)
MQLKTTMKLNARTTIETVVDAKDLEEAITQSAPLLDFTGLCGMCGSDDIKLNTRKSKDGKFTFTQYTCNKCGGKQPFGKLQLGGYFLKSWEPKFQGEAQA